MSGKQKPPISEWIVRERKRLGWKPADVSERLKAAGYEAEVSTVQVWEAGRAPKPETIDGLERLFDSTAPRETDIDAMRGEAIAAMTEAIKEQTAVFREMLQAMREDRNRSYTSEEVRALFDVLRAEGLLATPGIPEPMNEPDPPVLATRSKSRAASASPEPR